MTGLRSRILPIVWGLMRNFHRTHANPRILLVVGNDMNARHIGAIRDVLADESRFEFYTTEGLGSAEAARRFGEAVGAPWVSRKRAIFRWWELVVFASHHAPDHFHPDLPKLYVHHSHDSGKKAEGVDHRYGSSFVLDAAGNSRYTAFLEMSEFTRERVEREMPALTGRIRVVGDLMADDLLAASDRRQQIRSELGFSADEVVVLIMSTWGSDSLMETMGHEIIACAEALAGSYRFILSTHPNHWSGPHAADHPWGRELLAAKERGFTIVEPDDDWVRYGVAADIAITDHTSLAVTFALLGKPMLFVPLDESEIVEGSVGRDLYDSLPRLGSAKALEQALIDARSEFPLEVLRKIAARINSHPGGAAERIRAEIGRILEGDGSVRES